jgi:Na+-transporting NADH:ubiquinone oxidoreductase subunit C
MKYFAISEKERRDLMGKKQKGLFYSFSFSFVVAFTAGSILMGSQYLLTAKIQQNKIMEKMRSIFKIAGIDHSLYKDIGIKKFYSKNISSEKIAGFPQRLIYRKNGSVHRYIYPLKGKGFWGPIKGFISFDKSLFKIKGIVFTHQEETPGLGAEIATEKFYNKFKDKIISLTPKSNKIILHLSKAGQAKSPHDIDGITGATETTTLVEEMLNSTLKSVILNRQEIQK